MDAVRVVAVSDTHLSSLAPEALTNWDAVVGYVALAKPDLVVHLGDLTLHGSQDGAELIAARAMLDQLAVEWRAIPGNHDIGDNPWDGSSDESHVSLDRLGRWTRAIGADRWAHDIDSWTLIALNAQLFGSGLEIEATQWTWLEQQLNERPVDRRVVVLIHKPIAAPAAELAAAPPYAFVPSDARVHLESLFADRSVALVVSGHRHQYRSLRIDDRHHVWAPTTWAVLPEEVQPTFGAKRCGALSILLHADGRATADLIEPAGIAQLTLTKDVPDPYRH